MEKTEREIAAALRSGNRHRSFENGAPSGLKTDSDNRRIIYHGPPCEQCALHVCVCEHVCECVRGKASVVRTFDDP